MASILKPKKSNTPGAVPTTASLADGEMAVNTADKKFFVRVGAAIVDMFNRVFNPFNQGNGFVSWTGEATVTPSTSVALLDSTGAALSPTKTYKVAACNIDSSAKRGAVVLFVGDGSSFTAMTVYEHGTFSSNVQLYLNAGVPSVSVYGGSGSYRIPYRIEEVPNFGQALSEFGILQRITDAPSDGKTYGRKDAMWVEAGAGAAGKTLKQQTFTSSGTWTRPTGVDSVEVLLVGGGGGGGGAGSLASVAVGGGGGGGQVIRRVVAVSGDVTVTIGSGGAGGAASATTTPNKGSQGGTSSFGSLSAYGGGGGGGGGSGSDANAPTVINGGSGGGGGNSTGRPASGVGEASSSGCTGINNSDNTNPVAGSGGGAGMAAITGAASGTSTTGHGTVGGAGLYGFGGGGGDGSRSSCYGRGSSGGGNGGVWYGGDNGSANTGGGGGGAGGVTQAGGNGGSGICIVTWWE